MYDDLSLCKFCGKTIKWVSVNGRNTPVDSNTKFFNVDGRGRKKYITSDGRVHERCSSAPAENAQFRGYTLHANTCANWPHAKPIYAYKPKKTKYMASAEKTPEEKQKDCEAAYARGYGFMAAMVSRTSAEEVHEKAPLWYSSIGLYIEIIHDRYNITRAHAEGVIAAMLDVGIIADEVQEDAC